MTEDDHIQLEAERQFNRDTWESRIGLALAIAIGPLMWWAYLVSTNAGIPSPVPVTYAPSYGGAVFFGVRKCGLAEKS